MNRTSKTLNLLLFILLCASLLSLLYSFSMSGKPQPISYSEAVALFEQEMVKSFSTKDNVLTMKLRKEYDGRTELTCELASTEYFREDLGDLIRAQKEAGILEEYDYKPDTKTSWVVTALPYLLLFGAMILLFFVMMGRMGGGNGMAKFGKANVRVGITDGKRVTFDDVAGADEEKEELQ